MLIYLPQYVEEIIRQKEADERATNSEELAGIDNDTIINMANKGNLAHLINHHCNPNSKCEDNQFHLFQARIIPGAVEEWIVVI
jgi:hypothetical protein